MNEQPITQEPNQNDSALNNPQQAGAPQKERRTAVRSPLLFPVYDFGEARRIAEKVETAGGGRLEEHTLAVALGLSVKSSGFLLRALTARQFKLLQKTGSMLETTALAKAIFKPVNEEERLHAMTESFLSIPLFNAVATRFKGQPIPQGDVFRNILERELRIPHDRVSAAERVLLDSAREAKVLTTSKNNTYLSTDIAMQPVFVNPQEELTQDIQPTSIASEEAFGRPTLTSSKQTSSTAAPKEGVLPRISEEDLLLLKEDEFDSFWNAFGKMVRARAKRNQNQGEDDKGKYQEQK
jgi:hypothetical protein